MEKGDEEGENGEEGGRGRWKKTENKEVVKETAVNIWKGEGG